MGTALVPVAKPTVLDRLVGYVHPEAALRRMRARAGINFIAHRGGGGYEAGRSAPKDLQEWNPDEDSAITALHPGLRWMRARSRDIVRNSPLAAGASDLMARSVVGTGLRVHPMVDGQTLGLTDEQADDWCRRARLLFEAWATREGGCDISRQYTFEELQGLVFRGVFEGGDVLVLNRWLPDRGAVFASCLQMIESERVANPDYLEDTREVAGGVEVDEMTGMVKAYHVTRDHPGETYYWSDWLRLPAWSETGDRMARLVLRPTRIGERRGVPWLANVIRPLKQLERYTQAELQAAVIASFFTVFIQQEHADSHPLADGIMGDPGPESATAEAFREPGDIRLGPGLVMDLGEGEKADFADPSRPNSDYMPFVEQIWQHIGIGLGIPFEVFTMRFQSSFSASKGALAEAWKTFRLGRYWMTSRFCQPAYERFLAECVARGLIEAPGFFDDILTRRAWCRASWMGNAPGMIDPQKEVKAAVERIQAGLSTIDREAREMTGTTFEENLQQRSRETARMRETGVVMIGSADDADGNDGNDGDNGDDE